MNSSILKDNRFKVFFAVFVMVGWSLAYPLIKLGYQEFQIDGSDLGGKILFAGIRFFMAGTAVTLFSRFRKIDAAIRDRNTLGWLFLLGLVNTALHYMFAYIGLGFNSSARSTILDSMGGFLLIILSTAIFADDRMTWKKALGCILGIAAIVSININPGEDFFADITNLRHLTSAVFSNGAIYGTYLTEHQGQQSERLYLSIGYDRSITLLVWDDTMSESMLKTVAQTFVAAD